MEGDGRISGLAGKSGAVEHQHLLEWLRCGSWSAFTMPDKLSPTASLRDASPLLKTSHARLHGPVKTSYATQRRPHLETVPPTKAKHSTHICTPS